MAVSVSELLPDDAIGRNVRRSDSGLVHPVHCLTRGDVAFFATGTQLRDTRGQQPDKVEVRFKGHKGDQEWVGSVRVRTRSKVRGP